jgi:hypothetical protein
VTTNSLIIFDQRMWAQLGYDIDVNIDMTNVQGLQLLMATLDKEDLDAVSRFFQIVELPLLDRLFVHVNLNLAQIKLQFSWRKKVLKLTSSFAYSENQLQLPCEVSLDDIGSGAAAELAGEVDDASIYIYGDDLVLGHLRLIKVVNFRGTRLELMMLAFLMKRAPVIEQLVLVTVDEGEAPPPGDEQLKMIQERVSAMRKASLEVRVSVCRPSEDRSSQNPAHTK